MTSTIGEPGARALFRTRSAWGVEAVSDRIDDLDSGFHVVVLTFEGALTAVRMRHVERHDDDAWASAWAMENTGTPSCDPAPDVRVERDQPAPQRRGGVSVAPFPAGPAWSAGAAWSSTLDQEAYVQGVTSIREAIAAGSVYQVNLCRVLSRTGDDVDMDALFDDVLRHNPAPYACRIDIAGVLDVVSASPEMFLARLGASLASSPIKGTAVSADQMLAKDATENIMITDLVRNDLQRVCRPGTVEVDGLLETQHHPGLVHLVSTVRGELVDGARWADILDATFPPGSVSGAPKSSALDVIDRLESADRGPYCGAIGWLDADRDEAELAVGIRTFWREPRGGPAQGPHHGERALGSRVLSFGAGAGITWDSDPLAEWHETELKARRLLAIADGAQGPGRDDEHSDLG